MGLALGGVNAGLVGDHPDVAQLVLVHLVEDGAVEVLAHVALVVLVVETLALGADHDHVGQRGEAEHVGSRGGGRVLGHDLVVLEDAHHGVGVARASAHVAGHDDAVARGHGVADAHRASDLGGETLGEFGVVGVATGGDDEGLAAVDRAVLGLDGHGGAVLHSDLGGLGLGDDFDPGLLGGSKQGVGQHGASALDDVHHREGAVANDGLGLERNGATVDEPVDALAGLGDGDAHELGIKAVRSVAVEVVVHLLIGQLDALGLLDLGAEAADEALRGGGGAAGDGVLLKNEDRCAGIGSLDGSAQASAATTNDDDVIGGVVASHGDGGNGGYSCSSGGRCEERPARNVGHDCLLNIRDASP